MDKLLAILWELCPDVDFARETALVDNGILDSFTMISLVAELDDAFSLEIPAEALTAENFNSAEAMYAMVRRLGAE